MFSFSGNKNRTMKKLILDWGCRYITEGTLELTPDGLDTRSIDYGTGVCDAQATVSINNRDYNATLW